MDNDLNTPLHFAADEGRLAIIEYLLSAADQRGGWPMVTQVVSRASYLCFISVRMACCNFKNWDNNCFTDGGRQG